MVVDKQLRECLPTRLSYFSNALFLLSKIQVELQWNTNSYLELVAVRQDQDLHLVGEFFMQISRGFMEAKKLQWLRQP